MTTTNETKQAERQAAVYYVNQLDKVKPFSTEYAPTIKVFANGNGADTNHISLNNVSARILIKWLTDNYIK